MLKIFILCIGISIAYAKPVAIDESTANTNVENATAANGLHFGDKLDWFNPTTPKDASNLYSLSYLESGFPEMPSQSDPKYSPSDKPPPEREYRSQRSVPSTPSSIVPITSNNGTQFFNQVYQIVQSSNNSKGNNDNVRSSDNSNESTTVQTIPLNNLVSAVETTLVNVAQTLTNATNLTAAATNPNDHPIDHSTISIRKKRDATIDIVSSTTDTPTAQTIALAQLVNSVQSTLINVAQTLTNSTVNTNANTTTETPTIVKRDITTEDNSQNITSESATVPCSTLNQLLNTLGSALVNASQQNVPDTTTSNDTETSASTEKTNRQKRDDAEFEQNFEEIKPIFQMHNIEMLAPMAVRPKELNPTIDETTSEINDDNATNSVQIIQSINKTQLVSTDNGVRVQHDQISLLTAAPGILPGIPAFTFDKVLTVKTDDNNDTSMELNKKQANETLSDSNKNNGTETTEKSTTVVGDSTTTVIITTTVKPKTASEKLKEKLAEVEAEPVLLTQGI